MIPPLRSRAERDKLKEGIGDIYTIGTDHCPYTRAEKQNSDVDAIPAGVGGLGNGFAQMYRLFGDRIIDLFTRNQARVHGMYPQKGVLREGSDADIAIFEKTPPNPCSRILGQSDYSIYLSLDETISIRTVLSRGGFVVKDGKRYPHRGQYIERKLDFEHMYK